MKRIVIFGATGSVGAYTAVHLKELGHEVIAVGKRSTDNGFFEERDISYFSVDITHKNDFDILPAKEVDVVLHFAGNMPSKMEGYDPENYIESIVKGTFNVLEYCRKSEVSKIIFTQTRADSQYLMGTLEPISSNIVKKFPTKGDHSIYTICKNAAVDLIEHYYHEFGLERIILRLPTIYAYHPNKYFYVNGKKQTKAYRLLMDRASKGDTIEIWGNPDLQKEIVYVKDLSRLIGLVISSESGGGIYNVGNGKGVSLDEQIHGIVEVFSSSHKKSEIIYRKDKPDSRQFVHDISDTKAAFGFEPKFSYLDMLKDFKEEMTSNKFKKLWGEEN